MMPLTIVAEVGSNWWRPDPEEARECALAHVRAAARCGATAVKFQLFRADSLYSRERAPEQWEAVKKLELPEGWLNELGHEIRELGMEFWLTPFDPELMSRAVFEADVLKIASGDLTYMELLGHIFSEIPVAFSTGAANADEVRHAFDALKSCPSPTGSRKVILMYCVSNYPAKDEDYGLYRFPWSDLADEIGVSDHTTGNFLLARAIDWGYTVFEKHFMLEDTLPELPDVGVSMTPSVFKRYCEEAKTLFDRRYRSGFGGRTDEAERVWARRGKDGLRPNKEVK